MENGFMFFAGWCDDAILNYVPIESNSQKVFLSWQTWDLMRLTFYRFKDFTDSFFRRHPSDEHYIIPVRLNGSAVETLFSQLKYSEGGHLSSTNYAPARSNLLVKRQVRGHNVKDKEYHNIPLNLSSQPLKRRKTNKLSFRFFFFCLWLCSKDFFVPQHQLSSVLSNEFVTF